MGGLIKTFIYLIFICTSTGFLDAQAVQTIKPFIRFKKLTVNEGLSQNNTYSAFQDSKGFIWIGTSDKVNRFDGKKIATLDSLMSKTALAQDKAPRGVTCFAEDKWGRLWMGSDGDGVFNYDLRTES